MNGTNSEAETQAGKLRMNGSELAAMFTAAAAALEQNVEAINALNVFPVPDGDTGTNMFLTMQSGIDDLSALDAAPTASDAASAVYSGTFMGARGNSGVILSQFLKGFEEGLDGNVDCTPEDFARACALARHNAYKSVANPVEGTMLTVITSIAEAAREAVDEGADIQTTLRNASERARETVAKTTSMLPVLQEAGVVDAGGQGLAVVIEGFRRSVAGEDATDGGYDIQLPEGALSGGFRVSDDFLSAHEGDAYGYCTQFVVEAEGLDVDDLRDLMNGIAESTVVIGDGSRAMVHGHAEDPGRLVSVGVSAGSISKVKIENMDVQHSEFSSNLTTQGATTDTNASVVAVTLGDGFAEIFREHGSTHMVTGGNTMNPSVRDLLTAIDRSHADNVYLLPNNKNIIPTAKQAAQRSSKNVHVVETVSIPQGIAALFDFNPDAGHEENLEKMEAAKGDVATGEVTRAVRDSTMDGVPVREGQYIGLLDGSLVATGDDLKETLLDLISQAEVTDDTHITLYRGAMVSKSEADHCLEAIQNMYDAPEIEDVYGGQPHYEFIISIE